MPFFDLETGKEEIQWNYPPSANRLMNEYKTRARLIPGWIPGRYQHFTPQEIEIQDLKNENMVLKAKLRNFDMPEPISLRRKLVGNSGDPRCIPIYEWIHKFMGTSADPLYVPIHEWRPKGQDDGI